MRLSAMMMLSASSQSSGVVVGWTWGSCRGERQGARASTSQGQAQNRGDKVNSEHGGFWSLHQLLKGD